METLLGYLYIPLIAFALWGSGRWPAHWLGLAEPPLAFSAAIGLLAWAIAGGIAHYFAAVSPAFLDAMPIAGAAAAILWWWRRRPAFCPAAWNLSRPIEYLPLLPLLAATAFLAWGLLPTWTFNYHDDFYRYLVNLERLLQTGSMAGDPLSMVFSHQLGIQHLWQAIFVHHLPITYVNGFDVVLCFLLAGALAEALARRAGVAWPYRTLLTVLYVLLPPFQVNISPIYSGILVLLAMVHSVETATRQRPGARWLAMILLAGAFAGLALAIKVPVGVFALLFLGVSVFLLAYRAAADPEYPVWARWAPALIIPLGATAGAALVFAPWAASYPGHSLALVHFYLKGHSLILPEAALFAAALVGTLAAWPKRRGWRSLEWLAHPLVTLAILIGALAVLHFSGELARILPPGKWAALHLSSRVFYGGTLGQHIALIFAVILALLVAWWRRGGVPAIAFLAGLGTLVVLLLHTWNGELETLFRYAMPSLVVMATLGVIGTFAKKDADPGARVGSFTPPHPLPLTAAAGLALTVVAGLYVPQAGQRLRTVAQQHHMLGFPTSTRYRKIIRMQISPEYREALRSLQAQIPAHRRVLAWVGVPFQLDFRRNPLWILTYPYKLTTHLPGKTPTARAERLRKRLVTQGIEYTLWELGGNHKPWWPKVLSGIMAALAKQRPGVKIYGRQFAVIPLSG